MRQQLIQYVELLFAGAPQAQDIKQEILQNTLDRYDDLIAQGKSPEAAYQLAIGGIGDINELLTGISSDTHTPIAFSPAQVGTQNAKEKRLRKSIAIAMYIICPAPLIILSEFGLDVLGLCLLLVLVAAATVLLILNGDDEEKENGWHTASAPESELRKSVNSLISVIGVVAYCIVSFATQAWYITWVIFPMVSAVKGLVKAILDLKEANEYAP